MVDLLQATQDAIFAALNIPAVTGLAPVYTNVPPNTQPPFVEIGAIDAEPVGGKDGGLELHSVEIEVQFRGQTRRPLLALLSAVRTAIEDVDMSAADVAFGDARWLATATDRETDGVTYHGIHKFELFVQSGND